MGILLSAKLVNLPPHKAQILCYNNGNFVDVLSGQIVLNYNFLLEVQIYIDLTSLAQSTLFLFYFSLSGGHPLVVFGMHSVKGLDIRC